MYTLDWLLCMRKWLPMAILNNLARRISPYFIYKHATHRLSEVTNIQKQNKTKQKIEWRNERCTDRRRRRSQSRKWWQRKRWSSIMNFWKDKHRCDGTHTYCMHSAPLGFGSYCWTMFDEWCEWPLRLLRIIPLAAKHVYWIMACYWCACDCLIVHWRWMCCQP